MSDILQQMFGAVFAIAIALAGCVAYFWGTNWLLDRFLGTDAGRTRAGGEMTRRDSLNSADPAVAVPAPGAALPLGLSRLPGDRDVPAQLLRQDRPHLRRLRQLHLGLRRRQFPAVDLQQHPLADHRAVVRDGVRARHRGARGSAVVGQHRQVAGVHADGDQLRRRLGDLEIRLRLSRRRRSQIGLLNAIVTGFGCRRRPGSPSRSGTRSC